MTEDIDREQELRQIIEALFAIIETTSTMHTIAWAKVDALREKYQAILEGEMPINLGASSAAKQEPFSYNLEKEG